MIPVGRTRFSASFILSCLAEGMTVEEIEETYGTFPHEAIPEIMRLLPRCWTLRMWLLDVNLPKKIADVLGEFGIQAQSADAREWKGLANVAVL